MINGSEASENPLQAFVPAEEPVPVWQTAPSPSEEQAEQVDTPPMTVVRAILVDDQGIVRRSLRRDLRFETDLDVIGEASNAEAGLILAQEQHPDIVIMDVEMPFLEGLDAAERLHAMAPDCVLILLATRYSADVHVRGKAAGARVVMEKGNPEVFRNTLHDLIQFVKARNMPAWPEAGDVDAQGETNDQIQASEDRVAQGMAEQTQAMTIAMNVAVECTDGDCGKSSRVVLNPVTQQVTHIVVEIARLPSTERVVPLAMVEETSATTIRLCCAKEELKAMPDFVEHQYVRIDKRSGKLLEGDSALLGLASAGPSTLDAGYGPGTIMAFPYAVPDADYTTDVLVVDSESIAPNELAVRRGARVDASDGEVGHVDEFLVNAKSGYITHIVLREGHLWDQKEVTIPVAQIERVEENAVFLKLDKKAIEALPAIPVQRWY